MPVAPLIVTLLLAAQHAPRPAAPPPASAAAQPQAADAKMMDALRLQVMLDRAGFSPGAIDGHAGRNTQLALEAYTRQGGDPNAAIEPVTKYTIAAGDLAGPFAPEIPGDLMEQSKLPALAYRTPAEELAERFHTTPELLQRLNPESTFSEGETVAVPNVEPLVIPAEKLPKPAPGEQPAGTSGRRGAPAPKAEAPSKPDVVVTVSKTTSALTVEDASGRVIFYAPVTTGSEHDPLPIGEWKVNGVQFNPTFRYNPELFWDADPTHTKAQIPPGPNNPVGLVWIDISKEHYGLHGTPEPSAIGHVESHGCVRLTNWDALKLAGMVKPGTKVVFTE